MVVSTGCPSWSLSKVLPNNCLEYHCLAWKEWKSQPKSHLRLKPTDNSLLENSEVGPGTLSWNGQVTAGIAVYRHAERQKGSGFRWLLTMPVFPCSGADACNFLRVGRKSCKCNCMAYSNPTNNCKLFYYDICVPSFLFLIVFCLLDLEHRAVNYRNWQRCVLDDDDYSLFVRLMSTNCVPGPMLGM